jgi:hypothetical protein
MYKHVFIVKDKNTVSPWIRSRKELSRDLTLVAQRNLDLATGYRN